MNLIYASDASLSSQRANAVHVMKMCNALSSYFDHITLFCHEWSESNMVYQQYGVPRNFAIKKILSKSFPNLGARIMSVVSSFANAMSIRIHYKNSVVYGRSTLTLFFLKSAIPFIYEVHSAEDKGLFHFLESKILNRKGFRFLVVISKPLKEKYHEMYPFLKDEDIVVLHDGADCVSDFSSKVELKQIEEKDNDVKIGYLGSLYNGKCMEVLMPIAKRMPEQVFHVVGGDSYWVKYWQDELSKEGIDNIVFYGKVNPGDIGLYYNSFDICILPYSSNIYVDKNQHLDIGKWISPLKLFEAMSYGKAIVVSDLPSIREVMEDGIDCCLERANDTDGWVNSISNLISSPAARTQMGKSGRKKLEECYSWKMRSEKIYKKLNYDCGNE